VGAESDEDFGRSGKLDVFTLLAFAGPALSDVRAILTGARTVPRKSAFWVRVAALAHSRPTAPARGSRARERRSPLVDAHGCAGFNAGDAGALLTQVDSAMERLSAGYQNVKTKDRRCLVCGDGHYRQVVAPDGPDAIAKRGCIRAADVTASSPAATVATPSSSSSRARGPRQLGPSRDAGAFGKREKPQT
jgi:hypothetical protein